MKIPTKTSKIYLRRRVLFNLCSAVNAPEPTSTGAHRGMGGGREGGAAQRDSAAPPRAVRLSRRSTPRRTHLRPPPRRDSRYRIRHETPAAPPLLTVTHHGTRRSDASVYSRTCKFTAKGIFTRKSCIPVNLHARYIYT